MTPVGSLTGISSVLDVESRSISAENPTGEPGQGGRATTGTGANASRDLGLGWKVSPSIEIAAGATATIADIDGRGCITHIWLTTHRDHWRRLVFRAFWEGDDEPAVETPIGDFFCSGWGEFAQVNALPVAVNPNGGFNCYWEMPFRDNAKITIENTHDEPVIVYFQVDYWLGDVPSKAAHLHAQWRRSNPLPYKSVHTLLDGVEGPGHYVGTYMAWGVHNTGWWGEGEVKFYLDGDLDAEKPFPTICGTGTEDYFGGAWNFDVGHERGGYGEFSTPYLGMPQVLRPDGLYRSQQRFGMYRFHLPDPIRFREKLRVDVQALGWRAGGRYLPLQDDIASTAFFYSRKTSTARPPAPTFDTMEIR
ncbi:glycoside hydrolase family 172 protein [Pseudonocardia sp. TRM90224]|uniref:glycoside hydrolase family 172 protein n=1 Tax=Pseudonocardia sp. TRM90224 TaxID=2812678 RepID=UPI001E5CE409|nr:glycoside hydrolase family 172 protein [Pseudonocardia sp. TRM90224]